MQDQAIGPRLLPAVDLDPEAAPRTINTDQLEAAVALPAIARTIGADYLARGRHGRSSRTLGEVRVWCPACGGRLERVLTAPHISAGNYSSSTAARYAKMTASDEVGHARTELKARRRPSRPS